MQTLSSIMPLSPSADATQLCEAILREDINYNIEHAILPSENAVARRLWATEVGGTMTALPQAADSSKGWFRC